MGLGPLHPGREGRGREWREGWGRRVGKGMGRKGRGGRGNKHTRFKTCGAAHADTSGKVVPRACSHRAHKSKHSNVKMLAVRRS